MKASKPKPPIFWEFIKEDRDALLKEYRFRAEQGVIRLSGAIGGAPLGTMPMGTAYRDVPSYRMKGGPFGGMVQRAVVQKAIDWWAEQLDEINTRAHTERVAKLL